jgi:ABC-type oligopeptide transport system substrate-binding subunit
LQLYVTISHYLSLHIWSKLTGNAPLEYPNTDLVGSGPFKLMGYEQNAFVHLAANQTYLGKKPG